jgi:hypothetical protein
MTIPWEPLARGQHGVVARHQLRRLGWDDSAISWLVTSGRLRRLQPAVFAAAGCPSTFEQRAVAACLAHDKVVLIGPTAAAVWGFRRGADSAHIHVVVPATTAVRLTEATVLRSRHHDRLTVVQRDDGIRVTDPASTLAWLADRLDDAATESVVEQLIHQRRASCVDLAAAATTLRSPRNRGPARLRRVLAQRDGWNAAVHSDLELRVSRLIQARGLPTPRRQFEVVTAATVTLHPDFVWPDARVALEVDHTWWHSGRRELTRDHERDRLLLASGLVVIRVTEHDVNRGMADALDLIASLLVDRHRRAQPA